jgi:hypothetical protein
MELVLSDVLKYHVDMQDDTVSREVVVDGKNRKRGGSCFRIL